MFKNYHVVIFKDRQGGVRNLRLRGWIGLLLLLIFFASGGLCFYLWGFYNRAMVLEHELAEAQKVIQMHDSQMLSLTGKLQNLESDIGRVRQFDAKLRVMMNVDNEPETQQQEEDKTQNTLSAALNNPSLLSQHKELFTRRMHSLVEELSNSVYVEEVEQQTLAYFLRDNEDTLLATPSIWPVKGYLTSGFGWRSSPFTGRGRVHKGLDIANKIGTPIWAPARGTVTFSGLDGAYGISLTIDHGNNMVTRYAHMQKALVEKGAYVQRGDVIGLVGNTGRSTGPHLHYEVLVGGTPVDPRRYILN